jgi:hypothetical protein
MYLWGNKPNSAHRQREKGATERVCKTGWPYRHTRRCTEMPWLQRELASGGLLLLSRLKRSHRTCVSSRAFDGWCLHSWFFLRLQRHERLANGHLKCVIDTAISDLHSTQSAVTHTHTHTHTHAHTHAPVVTNTR